MENTTRGITLRDRIGYGLGDLGMQFMFGLIASVLQKYYTDILRIPIALVMLLFILARVWDAVNDPLWGMIVDSRPEHPKGRYRRWVQYISLPVAVCAVLMFVKVPGWSPIGYFAYACTTYTLFGMVYTCMNVPYGSMASVITSDDGERGSLSVYRAAGAALGAVPAMVLIMLCYKKVGDRSMMSYPRILVGVIIIAAMAAVCCLLCYRWTRERVITAPKNKLEKGAVRHAVARMLGSRPMLVLSASAMLFLAASVFSQSYYTYLADRYFGMPALSMLALVCQYVPMAVIMLFVGRLVRRFGRKELCAAGTTLAGVCNLVLFFLQTDNPIIFLALCFVAGIGISFMFLQIWALATEVIDYNAIVLDIHDKATGYSLFSFVRKLGHAVSAVFVNASLLKIGYSTDNLTEASLHGMYNSSVLIPAILYLAVSALLWFFYPLNKTKLGALHEGNKEAV